MRVMRRIGLVPIRARHAVMGVLAGLAYTMALVYLPNRDILSFIISAPVSPSDKVVAVANIIAGQQVQYGSIGAWLNVSNTLLFGINTALLTAYMEARVFLRKGALLNVTALTASLIGLGCVSCGSLLGIMLVASLGGASTAILDDAALYVGTVAILLFGISIAYLLRKMHQPAVCP